jgi:hypothetical protein
MRRLLAVLVLAGLVAACSEQPTATDSTPAFRAAQGDRSEWTLIWGFELPPDETSAVPMGFVPCINGGQGEDVVNWYGGLWEFLGKTTVTPSGHTVQQGWLRAPGQIDYYRGTTTQDLWVASDVDAKVKYDFFPDGSMMLVEPLIEVLVNQDTGERVRVHWMYQLHVNADGSVTPHSRVSTLMACTQLH